MNERIQQLVSALTTPGGERRMPQNEVAWLLTADDSALTEFWNELDRRADTASSLDEPLFTAVMRRVLERAHGEFGHRRRLSEEMRSAVVSLYGKLGAAFRARYLLLRLLTSSRFAEDLTAFSELLAADPPLDSTDVVVAVSPLFQHQDYDAELLFPRLLDAITQPSVVLAALDLANFVTREEMLTAHPAQQCQAQLKVLLGEVIQRLGTIEDHPEKVSGDEQELSRIVSDGVSLAVSLCDALALIGDQSAIGKLNQALELRHRRLRTEAAAALARLGDEIGRQVFISMAAEPVVRLRILRYAEELGLADQIPDEFATPAARAESELALWLSQPTQLGFPPSRMELVDSRVMYWPGYDDPVECFLFRFAYEMGNGEYANIGIAGPIAHSFAADMADFPADDIYAAFAGWHAEHEEINESDVTGISDARSPEVARLERRMRDEGYESIQPVTLGTFFGDKTLVARATRDGAPGIAVATAEFVQWVPTFGRRRPLSPSEAYCLFKGRRLLQAFNS